MGEEAEVPIEMTIRHPAERLTSPEAEFAHLARGMAKIAKSAGLSRETMYKAFRADGNPTLETLAEVTKALGYRLSIAHRD